jgi:hypothetical protein
MSVSGIFGNSLSTNRIHAQYQLTNTQFQQLGQDLAAGNLSSARSDFAIVQQAFAQPAASATSTASGSATSNPLVQAFQQLSSDLKSGDLASARKDYSTLQQDMQSLFSNFLHHGHHLRGGLDSFGLGKSQAGQDASSSLAQASGVAAQQSYARLLQQLQQYALGDASSPAGVSGLTNPVSLMA